MVSADEFDLQVGDVIIAGSDGLFDNLFDNELAEIVSEYCADVGELVSGAPDCRIEDLTTALHMASNIYLILNWSLLI